ncbi:TPA: type IV toxin-antitoxin system YeeU family antitoxin [Aeromonas sobria]|nr:type IV toxin-antitoxin system YeeU family antitoxin [Aeromonas sobria]
MITTTIHANSQPLADPDPSTRIFAEWELPHTVTPRFSARLIQEHHRLHFLPDRASLVGEWAEAAIDQLEASFPTIIKELESKLLTGELDAQRQQWAKFDYKEFICEADSLASHGYIYIAIYRNLNY